MGGGGRRILLVVVSLLLVFTLFIGALAYSFYGVYAQPKPYVALVELSGVIDYERPLLGGAITPGDARSVFDIVKRDPFAKAVVLIVNSPGGTAASFEVYELVRELSREKVVVAYITGYGTSGGYLIVLPADEIVAHPTAFVGSVGAIAVIISYKGLMDKLGINATTVKSGDLKDIGNPYREATLNDIEAVRRLINGVASVFAEKVREHRGDKIRDYREILRAGVYTGVEAERLGLVDMVGTLEDAIRRARELAGLPGDAPALWVERRVSLIDILLGRTSITTPMGGREPLAVEVLLMWPIPAELAGKTLLVVSSGG
ncbi:MAG: signal peptide peptidase SppA [Desulfurococcales archaeon]|nr:signal peptide peptidase SppA [Desulfurococcales archaeon]